VRLFVAIKLPEPVIQGLETVRGGLHEFDDVLRYPDPTGHHITLAFLGEQEAVMPEVIEAGLRAACAGFGAFNLDLGAGGSFPEGRAARLIWLRVEGEVRRIHALQEMVVAELRQLGLRLEERPFSPHVTLARVKRHATDQQRGHLREVAAGLDGYDLGSFTVSEVAIMASTLLPTGAVHTPLAEIPL
jgi:RNA 2',3'-cyclic 3'-phosphodiesterase